MLALIELDAGRFDAATAWNDRAHAADPGDARYLLQGARLAGLKGDHAGAFDRFATLLRAAPQSGTAWLEFAAAASASGRGAEAIATCISAFDADRLHHRVLGKNKSVFITLLPVFRLRNAPTDKSCA